MTTPQPFRSAHRTPCRLVRAPLAFALSLALLAPASAEPPSDPPPDAPELSVESFHSFLKAHLPERGTAIAAYRELNAPIGTVIGYDIASGAWFSIYDVNVRVLEPGGDYYSSPRDGGFDAGLEHQPTRRRPHSKTIDWNMPATLLIDIIHHPDKLTSLSRLPDGAWSATYTFPMGDRDFNMETWPAGFQLRQIEQTVVVAPDGTPISFKSGSEETREFDLAPDAPPRFPIAHRNVRKVTGMNNGELVDAGTVLLSFKWFPEGRPELFSHTAVLERARSAGTRRKQVRLLPPGVEWVYHDEHCPAARAFPDGVYPSPHVATAPERHIIALPIDATPDSLPEHIANPPLDEPAALFPQTLASMLQNARAQHLQTYRVSLGKPIGPPPPSPWRWVLLGAGGVLIVGSLLWRFARR